MPDCVRHRADVCVLRVWLVVGVPAETPRHVEGCRKAVAEVPA